VRRLSLVMMLATAPLAGQSAALHLDRVESMERSWVRGDRSQALAWARAVTSAWERADRGANWSAADLIVAGRAWRMLGADDPGAVRQALAAFDAATARDTTAVEGRLWAADLLLERYNAPDASAEYRAVLQRDSVNARAWLGLARAAAFEGREDAATLAERSVAADSSFAPAQLLLAQVRLEAEQYDSARVSAERGIALDGEREDGWGTFAAVAWLSDDHDAFLAAEQRARALNPRPAGFYVTLADAAARHRRYADAVRFADQARTLDSLNARAWGILGINQLRVGKMEQGRASLERAFARDPFHVWHKNTLDLLDQLAKFRTVETERFRIVAPERDAEFLGTILGPLLEEAYDSLAARYDYHPPTPVRLELYSRHADFSVRTIGLTGMGALGVSFGTVLAMDAPAARQPGSWNIGSTAWHELAHTFTLGLSAHRVPRWVSEGLSVVEERRARPGWGAHASVAFVTSLHKGELLPIVRLNEGFTRPSGPGQLSLAYYQASLVAEMLERDFGIEAIRVLLRSYAGGMADDAALLHATGLTTDSLNVRFDGWLRQRFAAPLAALADDEQALFGSTLREAGAALDGGNIALAVELFREARDRFPEFGDANGPNGGLALALLAAGDTVGALAALKTVTHQDETAGAANVMEAAVHAARADTVAALAALARAAWIMPEDVDIRGHRAELSAAIGDFRGAVAERRALAALARTDPLSARTDLAEALLAADDPAEARRQLLDVLEAAPRYERAQALLLEARARLNGGGKP
jgi:tetratricopeptide (TPR) repeat protein